jgi:hypothetical protein
VTTCLCGHAEDRHDRNAAGSHRGACLAALCGCLWFRPDPSVRDELAATTEGAA